MNAYAYECYRLSVVEQMPDSPYKRALVKGIQHKMMCLDQEALDSSNRSQGSDTGEELG